MAVDLWNNVCLQIFWEKDQVVEFQFTVMFFLELIP
jgi:hypothetical protein